MNVRTITLSFFALLISFSSFSQLEKAKETILSDTFCFSNHKPLPFVAGTKFFVQCDTVYVLNKHTMKLYKEVATVLKRGTGLNTCNLMVENLEKRLEAQNKSFMELHQKYLNLENTSQQMINDTKISLTQVNNNLGKTQNDIGEVDKKMDDLKKTVNKQRAQSFLDKILYGTGGVAVGILVGLIIAN